jgi:hypothetical protein
MSGTQPTSEFIVEQMLPEVRKGRMLMIDGALVRPRQSVE